VRGKVDDQLTPRALERASQHRCRHGSLSTITIANTVGDRLTSADVTSNVRQSIEYIHIDAPCVTAELRFEMSAP